MSSAEHIMAIDVGTTKVCTIIASINPQTHEYEISGVGSHPSHGLKKGTVVNIDKTVYSIRASVEEAKMMSGVQDIKEATIGIAGNHIYCFNSSGVVSVKNPEIQQDDLERVIEAAKAVLIPTDREVLHVISQEYKVDNTNGIRNPIGMCGSRLEAYVHIVTGKTNLIQNLLKCIELCHITPKEIVLQPIASSCSVLTGEEKEVGVVLVDIGGGTTDIAVWKNSSLIHSQIIPVGGNHFTNDLAVALKIPHSEAERIKVNHGSVLRSVIDQQTHLTVHGINDSRPREIEIGEIADVLGARAEELFQVIYQILEEKELIDLINGGFVLTGGGSLIKGMCELGEYLIQFPIKIGYPRPFEAMTSVMQNPKFSTVLGLLLESRAYKERKKDIKSQAIQSSKFESKKSDHSDLFNRFGESLKNVFKEIF